MGLVSIGELQVQVFAEVDILLSGDLVRGDNDFGFVSNPLYIVRRVSKRNI